MDSNSGVITVIIPTFNRKDMLKNALDSVLSETRIPIKAHVFDNASTDGTQHYLQERAAQDPRLVITRNDTNIGALGNYKKALSSVETDFYVPLGDDDWLLPDFLFEAHALLQQEPEAYAAVSFGEARDNSGKLGGTYPERTANFPTGLLSPREHLKEFFDRGHYLWSAVVWRRETLDYIGYPFLHTGLSSDVDFQIQIFAKFPVVALNKMGATFNVHSGAHASGKYSILDIPSWGALAVRMNKVLSELYSPRECSEIKESFRNRYSPTWRKAPRETVDKMKLDELATIARNQLEDIELATNLAKGKVRTRRRSLWQKVSRSAKKRLQFLNPK